MIRRKLKPAGFRFPAAQWHARVFPPKQRFAPIRNSRAGRVGRYTTWRMSFHNRMTGWPCS